VWSLSRPVPVLIINGTDDPLVPWAGGDIHFGKTDRKGEASALCNIGNVYQIKGELDKALEQYQLALKIFEEIGAEREIVKTKNIINSLARQVNE
ncbi:MAG: hypothetical protein MUO97_09940, partial [Dehalococcoidia bacterium]|nr:hypothetical protein [Dehalococcoidia bacterium]